MKQLAVLITCHNRRVTTLKCLQALYACTVPEGYSFEVFLVDDGSVDGTGDAVRMQYPAVHVIEGNGNLYWNRGMRLAWETAAKSAAYDFYLWLNDDSIIYDNALNVLLRNCESLDNHSIICGVCMSKSKYLITYGGFEQYTHKIITPNGELQRCYFFNGNVVLIPKYVFEKVGNLDPYFQHAFGDFDYGLRALKQNIFSYISSEVVARCEKNELSTWCNPDISFLKRIESLYSPLGMPPIQHFIYAKRHWGIFKAINNYFSIHLRVFFPNLWLNKK